MSNQNAPGGAPNASAAQHSAQKQDAAPYRELEMTLASQSTHTNTVSQRDSAERGAPPNMQNAMREYFESRNADGTQARENVYYHCSDTREVEDYDDVVSYEEHTDAQVTPVHAYYAQQDQLDYEHNVQQHAQDAPPPPARTGGTNNYAAYESQESIDSRVRAAQDGRGRRGGRGHEKCCFCCCFSKDQFVGVVLVCVLAAYVIALFLSALDAYQNSHNAYCVNASRWTMALAALLSAGPCAYAYCDKIVRWTGVDARTGLLTVTKRNVLSIAESVIGRVVLMFSFVVSTWLTVYMFKLNAAVNDCAWMLNLFQFFLIMYWFCFYLLAKAFSETAPEALLPDAQTLYAEM